MKNFLIAFFLIFLPSAGRLSAQTPDPDNIVIAERKERYEFIKGDKNNPVLVTENYYTRYRCNSFRASVPYMQFYNDQSRIDDVSISVSGKKQKSIKPTYEYYSAENIFYSDARVCYFDLPLEKKGSESEVELIRTVLDPKYFTTIYFPEMLALETKTIEFVVPSWMKVSFREMNFAGYNIVKTQVKDSRRNAEIITYTVKAMKAQKKLPGMPGPSHIYPHLMVLTQEAETEAGTIKYFSSIEEQYKWYHSLVAKLTVTTPEITAKSAAITAGITDPIEKMKKVLHWVQDNIRYIAFENGIAGFKPAEANDVLARKYGDCKGMANLTRSLLKAAGLDARLCWIGTSHLAYDYSTPSLIVDNHMICAVVQGKQTYFLDGTESYIGFDEYAQRIQGRQVLIDDGDNFVLDRVPLRTHTQNVHTENSVMTISGTSLKGKVNMIWKGESKSDLLSSVHASAMQEQQSELIRYFSNGKKNYSIGSLVVPSLKDWSGDVKASYDVEWKDATSFFGNELYLEPDFRRELSGAHIDTTGRNADYELPYKMHMEQKTTFLLPTGFIVKSIPEPLLIERDGYYIKATVAKNKEGLLYEKTIFFKTTKIPVAGFKQWNEDMAALKNTYNEQIILTRP